MCLVTDNVIEYTADSDRIVYKLFAFKNKNILKTGYMAFKYEIGIPYEAPLKPDTNTRSVACFDSIDQEYLDEKYPDWYENPSKYNLVVISDGIHSFLSKERILSNKRELGIINNYMAKCIIPAGSRYYMDATGLVASDKLIVTDEIEKLYP